MMELSPDFGQNDLAWLLCFYHQLQQNKHKIVAMHLFCIKELLKWNKSMHLSLINTALYFHFLW